MQSRVRQKETSLRWILILQRQVNPPSSSLLRLASAIRAAASLTTNKLTRRFRIKRPLLAQDIPVIRRPMAHLLDFTNRNVEKWKGKKQADHGPNYFRDRRGGLVLNYTMSFFPSAHSPGRRRRHTK